MLLKLVEVNEKLVHKHWHLFNLQFLCLSQISQFNCPVSHNHFLQVTTSYCTALPFPSLSHDFHWKKVVLAVTNVYQMEPQKWLHLGGISLCSAPATFLPFSRVLVFPSVPALVPATFLPFSHVPVFPSVPARVPATSSPPRPLSPDACAPCPRARSLAQAFL